MMVFAHMYVYVVWCNAHGGQKRVLNPLELELHVVVSHPLGAGNSISLCKNSNRAQPLL